VLWLAPFAKDVVYSEKLSRGKKLPNFFWITFANWGMHDINFRKLRNFWNSLTYFMGNNVRGFNDAEEKWKFANKVINNHIWYHWCKYFLYLLKFNMLQFFLKRSIYTFSLKVVACGSIICFMFRVIHHEC